MLTKITSLEKITKYFITLELLDILTTFWGIYILGHGEKNLLSRGLSFPGLMALKVLVIIVVAILLERLPFEKSEDIRIKFLINFALLFIPFFAVIWNIVRMSGTIGIIYGWW